MILTIQKVWDAIESGRIKSVSYGKSAHPDHEFFCTLHVPGDTNVNNPTGHGTSIRNAVIAALDKLDSPRQVQHQEPAVTSAPVAPMVTRAPAAPMAAPTAPSAPRAPAAPAAPKAPGV